jgi:hypothetical protein
MALNVPHTKSGNRSVRKASDHRLGDRNSITSRDMVLRSSRPGHPACPVGIGNESGASNWPLIFVECRGQECLELYFNVPSSRYHDAVLSHKRNFTSTLNTFQGRNFMYSHDRYADGRGVATSSFKD